MNPIILSQWQFAITTVYHFFFVPLTLGLSILVAIMETIYVRTGQNVYKRMAKFWGKLFLINFAMGVVTGIVQEFQFGMNWSEYSRFVGDIFGAPLAIEALLAFFLESTFLGIWIFGWDKLPKKIHVLSIWLVAIGANISALWILIANSFMQHPVGYSLEGGRAVMTDFFALITNPYLPGQFLHTFFSGFATASFFVMGISVFHLARKNEENLFTRSLKIAAIGGLVASLALAGVGHMQAQDIMEFNPMKMIASEALWNSENPASMSIITYADQQNKTNLVDLRMPAALSFLVNNRFSGEVAGINQLQAQYETLYGPGNYIPNINITNYSFRIMVGIGTLLILIALLFVFRIVIKKPLVSQNKLIKFFPIVILLPYLANSSGWILTEMGRQPWAVFGLMKTADAVSPNVTGGMVLTSLILFTLVYGGLMAADGYLMLKYAKAGPEETIETDGQAEKDLQAEAGA